MSEQEDEDRGRVLLSPVGSMGRLEAQARQELAGNGTVHNVSMISMLLLLEELGGGGESLQGGGS